MARKIVVYGNPDERESMGFPTAESFVKYIAADIFSVDDGRYRFTQHKDADLIVMSRGGLAFGHFDIISKALPTDTDRKDYPPVKQVYLVSSSTIYKQPVRLAEIGILGIQFGKQISEEEFQSVLSKGGVEGEYGVDSAAQEVPALKYAEGAVRRVLVNSYERDRRAVEDCKAHYGTRCQVCDLDMLERYGEIGRGFVHIHHLRELALAGGVYEVDPINDLRPVCPNCHAMLHRTRPALSIEELRSRLHSAIELRLDSNRPQ